MSDVRPTHDRPGVRRTGQCVIDTCERCGVNWLGIRASSAALRRRLIPRAIDRSQTVRLDMVATPPHGHTSRPPPLTEVLSCVE